MDALSQALAAVRVSGAIFFRVECAAPWGFAVPPAPQAIELLAPGAERLVQYHLVTDGAAQLRLAEGELIQVTAGDIVVLPRGDAHTVSDGVPAIWLDPRELLASGAQQRPRAIRIGEGDAGEGQRTRIVCGFFACDAQADLLFLAGLPSVFKVNLRTDDTGAWLERTVQLAVDAAQQEQPGAGAVLSKLAEALLVAALRRHVPQQTDGSACWLAGARDRIVGPALARLHAQPAHRWTLAELCAQVGSSRTVLAQRFRSLLGVAPMSYLTHWRMQLAARALDGNAQRSIQRIAQDVGFASEAAFSRAFSRAFGLPPAAYRKRGSDPASGERESPRAGR